MHVLTCQIIQYVIIQYVLVENLPNLYPMYFPLYMQQYYRLDCVSLYICVCVLVHTNVWVPMYNCAFVSCVERPML